MSIIKAQNVRSEFVAGYRVAGPPRFEKRGPFTNADNEEFFRVDYVLPVEEIYPSTDGSRTRDIRISTTRAQAASILANMEGGSEKVTMHTNSALGRFVLSAAKAGLKVDVDDDAMEDTILVMSNATVQQPNGWRDTQWSVRAVLGTTNTLDPEKVRAVVDGYNEDTKQTSAAAY